MARRSLASTPARTAAARASATPRRWLLFVHQLPSSPSNLRVKTWRRLQALGALALKQALYVLPDSPTAREDFAWLTSEVQGLGGEASVFAASCVDGWTDDAVVDAFRRDRQASFGALAAEIDEALERLDASRRRPAAREAVKQAQALRQRLADLDRVDFFGGAGRDGAAARLDRLDARLALAGPTPDRRDEGRQAYRGRLWVTRPRPGVDRMGSAWLIRRFIDASARFGFVADRAAVAGDAVAFDMFGVGFGHRGGCCTFETLCQVFGVDDPAVARLAAIVHDLDLKDGRFGAVEAPSIGLVIDGLQRIHEDDDALLAQGIQLFEALYLAEAATARRSRPRPIVPPAEPRPARRRGSAR